MTSFPINVEEALKSGVYCSGTTGTGKSDIGMYIVDEMKEYVKEHYIELGLTKPEIMFIVFDPTQDWLTRSSLDYVFDPKNPDTTNIWKSTTKNFIFDTSMMDDHEQQQFIEQFCDTIMDVWASLKPEQRKPVFIIFEEAHTVFGEGQIRSKRLRHTRRMMTQGRNFNIRFMCITQFAAMIDKNAMRYMKQRYFGSTDEPNDVEYIVKFFPKAMKDYAEKTLRQMQAGEFLYKNGYDFDQFKIAPYHSEKTPKRFEWNPDHFGMRQVPAAPPKPTPSPQANNALAKAIVITVIGAIVLWLTLGGR